MPEIEGLFWKENWDITKERHIAWWQHEGLVLHVLARRDQTLQSVGNPQAPFYHLMGGLDATATCKDNLEIQDFWLDPSRRARLAERFLPGIYFGGEAFPFFDTQTGPGNLATFLGSEPSFAIDTVWYKPCIRDLDSPQSLYFDPNNSWFQKQKAILEAGMEISQGRFLVSMPDLVENIDILASLRGTQALMIDMIERPDYIRARTTEINQIYFYAFSQFYNVIAPFWGGNVFSAFCIWGPGKTAKVQCDTAAMISPQMFTELVVPSLTEQCEWLDFSMFHLDGTQAIRHLDALLEIEALDAIEWTPQVNVPQGGDPTWFDLYRKILDANKSIQAINVRPDEVIPLLDAIGTQGVFIMVNAESESEARSLVETVEAYR